MPWMESMAKSSSPKRRTPVRRSDFRARIFSRPPRAARWRATSSSTLAAASGDGGGAGAEGEVAAGEPAPVGACDGRCVAEGEQAGVSARTREAARAETKGSAPGMRAENRVFASMVQMGYHAERGGERARILAKFRGVDRDTSP